MSKYDKVLDINKLERRQAHIHLTQTGDNMPTNKNKSNQSSINRKPKKILFPFRQIAVRSRCLHRLNPQEMMISKKVY